MDIKLILGVIVGFVIGFFAGFGLDIYLYYWGVKRERTRQENKKKMK